MFCILKVETKLYSGQKQKMAYVFCNLYKRFGWVFLSSIKREVSTTGRNFTPRTFEQCASAEDFLSQYEAGKSLYSIGRYYIKYQGKRMLWSHLVWKAHNNFETINKDEEIDHINAVPTDNRIQNLRKVSRSQNRLNKNSQKKIYNKNYDAPIGVQFDKTTQKWRASYKKLQSPRFKNKKDAVAWRLKKESECLDYQKVNS